MATLDARSATTSQRMGRNTPSLHKEIPLAQYLAFVANSPRKSYAPGASSNRWPSRSPRHNESNLPRHMLAYNASVLPPTMHACSLDRRHSRRRTSPATPWEAVLFKRPPTESIFAPPDILGRIYKVQESLASLTLRAAQNFKSTLMSTSSTFNDLGITFLAVLPPEDKIHLLVPICCATRCARIELQHLDG